MFAKNSSITRLGKFLREEDGPTAVEYAILLAVIILSSIGAVLMTGDVQKALWIDSGNTLSGAFQDSMGTGGGN